MTVILPDTAFISRFAIELGGQLFVAYVREKENAWREYQEAVSKGKTAGKYEQILENLFWIILPSWVRYPKEKFLPVCIYSLNFNLYPQGHVGISARHSNQFRVSVNTEAKSR